MIEQIKTRRPRDNKKENREHQFICLYEKRRKTLWIYDDDDWKFKSFFWFDV